ncbi:hypothetical protein [Methylophilus sp. 3sh_L]|uniref:hypothetical protein n=1 Tax=Methylophilus sp. 3sh_L TaxID=3377114 RepID=UPI00398EE584
MPNNQCPICKSTNLKETVIGDGAVINCPRCGQFTISETAAEIWRNKYPSLRKIANASGWIKEHQDCEINSDQIESLLKIPTPSVAERAKRLLILLSSLLPDISSRISFDLGGETNQWLATTYSDNSLELLYLFRDFLKEESGFINFTESITNELLQLRITPKGYSFLDSLKQRNDSSNIGFCAMWFDHSVFEVWQEAIEPAIRSAGYLPKRIDSHAHNNRIDDEIIAMIRQSKFVVADFTGQRGGVYFEAGFALGLGLPVIWTCKKSDLSSVHFDNRQYNFVLWDETKLDEFKSALQNRIEATIGKGSLRL